MSECILKVNNLTKCYNNVMVLDGVSFTIEQGKIYGFIGENGAGKTTTIRILAGLSEATDGEIEILGQTERKQLESVRRKIGTLVEKPILYDTLSAIDNMNMQCILYGQKNTNIVPQLLEKVDLANVKKKKVKDFSLGMKQRLGIAMALVQEPKLLILDEPVNGLDPMGMVDIRELLKSLNKDYGITIIISSHILTELYQLATDYIIINKGKIVEIMTLEELNDKCKKHIIIETDEALKATETIRRELGTENYIVSENTIKLYDCIDDVKKVAKILFADGILVTRFTVVGENLEEYYIDLLGGK
ncbi:ABC transporter ATP-binding protein [Clostridium vincentii]|uniref:Putative ABC transporter ATP-binding protein YxlF n=1 Tax=Clostridium vincentii TaxID=52704 RepID=A0A2T0BBM0_9CLOT|nr:ABC transporter ATP-binding protein [Clostridium vincentii]PRR81207.1 putative ABC transporter ATP-binding protein YxlF [Clostridium vincentii]